MERICCSVMVWFGPAQTTPHIHKSTFPLHALDPADARLCGTKHYTKNNSTNHALAIADNEDECFDFRHLAKQYNNPTEPVTGEKNRRSYLT